MEQVLTFMAGAMLVLEAARSPRPLSRFALIGGMLLMFYGQYRLLDGDMEAGRTVYLPGAALLLAYVIASRRRADTALAPGRWLGFQRWELLAFLGVLVIAGVFRFWRIGAYPYGMDGDERSWSIESLFMALSGEFTRGGQGHWHSLPVSFLMQRPFFWVFGYNFMSPRYAVAFFSFISTIPFYLMARRLGGRWVGLVASLLLACSISDTAASRVGLVEAHPKFWVILTMFLIVLALDLRHPLVFALAGASIFCGVLTYETFYPIVAVVGLVFLLQLVRRRSPVWLNAANGLALATPLILIASNVREYVEARQEYHFIDWTQHKGNASGFLDLSWAGITYAGEKLEALLRMIFVHQPADYLIIRNGPLTNAALVPFFVLGLLVVVSRIRRVEMSVIALWLAVGLLVPTATRDPSLRTVYSALPAFYLVTAIGMVFLAQRLFADSNWALPPLRGVSPFLVAVPLVVAFGAATMVVNWRVYFHELQDPDDRQDIRELFDRVSSLTAEGHMLILPVRSSHVDRLEAEADGIRVATASHTGFAKAPEHYRYVAFENLVEAITRSREAGQEPAVVYDKRLEPEQSQPQDAINQMLSCYPLAELRRGRFFDVYVYSRDALNSEMCYGAPRPTPLSPDQSVPSGTPLVLSWQSEARQQTGYRVLLERRRPGLIFVEAEDFAQLNGWTKGTRFAPGFSGRGFLVDPLRMVEATHEVAVPQEGEYYLWVRSYRRVVDRSRNFVSVDGQSWLFSDPAQSVPLNQWAWSRVGPVWLSAGSHSIGLAREPDRDVFEHMFVDSLILTSDPQVNPEETSLWETVVDTGLVPSQSTSFAVAPDVVVPGEYQWRVQVFDGDRLVSADGSLGIWSDAREFSVTSGPGD
jgi:4-amino-4-deoxy-L-arabinose transferase-like glycosyltransferase